MKTFEVEAPDGRLIRHRVECLDRLKAALAPGYPVVSEVFGANAKGEGGYPVPFGGKSLTSTLLDADGDELEAWLLARGFVKKSQ